MANVNEETRLREELAEAREHHGNLQDSHFVLEDALAAETARATAAESEIASLKGSLASANDKALMRGRAAHEAQEKLRAAESALAEARVALRDAWKIAGESIDDVRAEWSRLGDTIDATSARFRAALARAGEQETPSVATQIGSAPDRNGLVTRAPAGEPASGGQEVAHAGVLDRREPGAGAAGSAGGVADGLSQGHAPKEVAPTPGEQGKGGGEGLREVLADAAREVASWPSWKRSDAVRAELAKLAPAQPAEHRDYDPITSPIPEGDMNGPHGPIPPAEHPASGGEDGYCSACNSTRGTHQRWCRLWPVATNNPDRIAAPTPAPGAGEQEEG